MSYLLTAVGALKSVQLGFPVWIVVLSFLKNIYIYILIQLKMLTQATLRSEYDKSFVHRTLFYQQNQDFYARPQGMK